MPSMTLARLVNCPVVRLSRTRTTWPRPTRASTRWDPMKPAPPVTRQTAISLVSLRLGGYALVRANRARGPCRTGRARAAPTVARSFQAEAQGLGPFRQRRFLQGVQGLLHPFLQGLLQGDPRLGGFLLHLIGLGEMEV